MVTTNWYYQINDYCKTLSEHYNVSLIQIAGIMSALSPNNTFYSNVKSLERFLETKGNCKVTCFTSQKNKAIKILNMRKPNEEKIKTTLGNGLKTRAFFENIYRPETSLSATVDLWMIRWARQKNIIPKTGVLTDKRYRLIESELQNRAKKLNILPHQLQAKIWVDIRGKAF